MFSTSSSEYNFSGPYHFGTTIPNILGNPFCSTARQPLIYYAKIDEPFHGQPNSGHRKDKSNCFMKAFRWYTQEHGSSQKNETRASQENDNGFAAWLDKKYSEYLKGSQEGSDVVLKQPAIIEADAIPKKKKSSKKFGRMRSPWSRRRGLNQKENDLSFNNPHLSFQYILQPQDLSRTASECCPRPSQIQSTTTIVSKDSQKHSKVKVKSKSVLSIYRAQRERENKMKTKEIPKNVVCTCVKQDTGTQYETYSLENLMSPRNCRKGREEKMIKETVGDQATSKLLKTAVMFTDDAHMNTPEFQNLSVQTSDHSINFDYMMYEQPIFLKVIHVNQ